MEDKAVKKEAKDKGKEILEGPKKGAQDYSALVAERLPELTKLAEVFLPFSLLTPVRHCTLHRLWRPPELADHVFLFCPCPVPYS